MILRRTFFVIAVLLVLSAQSLRAGDTAFFADLGFSPDGSHYMFAQYGVRTGTLRSWADLFIVDAAKNDFVPGGRFSYAHERPINAGQDGTGALYNLVTQSTDLAGHYGISHTNQGQPLYIALEGDPAYEGEPISFRDFVSGVSYKASLTETISGSGQNLRSSFYITLESLDSGNASRTFTIGTPNLSRPLISSYRIQQVLRNPAGNSLIFVIQMKRQTESSHDIRYMVEALRF